MIKPVSTFALLNQRNAAIRTLEADLARANQEIATGVKSDVAGDIGAQTDTLIGLRALWAENDAYLQSIDTFERRASFINLALEAVETAANDLVATTALNVPSAGASISALGSAARATISSVVAALNASVDGRALFSGVATDVLPLRPADETNPATTLSGNDVITQVLSGVAYTPAQPPAFASYTAAEAATAVARLTDVFSGVNAAAAPPLDAFSFEQTFYSGAPLGSSASVKFDANGPVPYGIRADDPAIRNILQGAYMLAGVDLQALAGTEAYEPYVSAALERLVSGLDAVRLHAADLGSTQNRVERHRDSIVAQNVVVNTQVMAFEQADPIETQSRFSEIEKQLDAAYAATVRATRLRLTNYL